MLGIEDKVVVITGASPTESGRRQRSCSLSTVRRSSSARGSDRLEALADRKAERLIRSHSQKLTHIR